MPPSTEELMKAYNRTGLNRVGYSFEKAMQCELTKKCLVRMALNARKKQAIPGSRKTATQPAMHQAPSYWWQKF